MKTLARSRKAPGFTLVELMVAITIGLIILAVISQVYVGSKRTYRVQEGLSRLQENGRYAVDFLGRDIRMAGYMGCVGTSATLNNIANPIVGWTPLTAAIPPTLKGIFGYEKADIAGMAPAGFPVKPAEVKDNTDLIVIQHFSATGAKVFTPVSPPPTTAEVKISGNSLGFQQYEVLIVSDCVSADFFKATTVSNSAGIVTIAHSTSNNTSNNTSKPYNANAEIMRMETSVYYISSGAVANGCPADSLCRKRLGFYLTGDPNAWCTNATAGTIQGFCVEQVAEGVEDMQVLYGVNGSGSANHTADRFVDAAAITTDDCNISQICWPNVVSARINLLLRTVDATVSPENLLTYPVSQIPLFDGFPPVIATPRAYRRVYTETVVLRNRAL